VRSFILLFLPVQVKLNSLLLLYGLTHKDVLENASPDALISKKPPVKQARTETEYFVDAAGICCTRTGSALRSSLFIHCIARIKAVLPPLFSKLKYTTVLTYFFKNKIYVRGK